MVLTVRCAMVLCESWGTVLCIAAQERMLLAVNSTVHE